MDKFVVSSISITRRQTESINSFTDRILINFKTVPSDALVVVFPEYCWGISTFNEIKTSIHKIRSECNFNIIFGTTAFDTGLGRITNNAIIALKDEDITYSAKTKPMDGEQNKHYVRPGKNIGVFSIEGIKVGILICADLWNWPLVHDLIIKQGAQLLIIPAFTVVPKGLHSYAKYQWLSLAITRSREFVIPIIISDHLEGTKEYDVGGVSCIIDPSLKNPEITSIEGFVNMNKTDVISTQINLQPIQEYRVYRDNNGLLQK